MMLGIPPTRNAHQFQSAKRIIFQRRSYKSWHEQLRKELYLRRLERGHDAPELSLKCHQFDATWNTKLEFTTFLRRIIGSPAQFTNGGEGYDVSQSSSVDAENNSSSSNPLTTHNHHHPPNQIGARRVVKATRDPSFTPLIKAMRRAFDSTWRHFDEQCCEQLAVKGRSVLRQYLEGRLEARGVAKFLVPHLLNSVCGERSKWHLDHIARHIGLHWLVLDSQHEKKPNYSSQLLAFVAMLENREQQEKFLKEFFLTRLMNNDLLEYVSPLSEIIDEYNRIENNECNFKKVEFRILRTCGSTSVMPLFVIGLFGDYRLYSYGCGETVEIAIEMSKIDFVRRFYKLQPERYILDLI